LKDFYSVYFPEGTEDIGVRYGRFYGKRSFNFSSIFSMRFPSVSRMIPLVASTSLNSGAEEGRIVPAYEPEDLPGAIMEAVKRQNEKGKGK